MALTLSGDNKTVLQVVQSQLNYSVTGTTANTGGGWFADVPQMNATIVPASITSKILVMVTLWAGATTANGAAGYQEQIRIRRNGVYPIVGAQEGTRPRVTGRINMYASAAYSTYAMGCITGQWLDSPLSTTAQTYQIEFGGYSTSTTYYINRAETFQQTANDYDGVPVSTLTLMEIAG